MRRYYERTWSDHDGYWFDKYPPSQRIYAVSLYGVRNEWILASVPYNVRGALDIGCGLGDVMLLLAKQCQTLCGLDMVLANARQTRRNLRRSGAMNTNVAQGLSEELPFQSHTFDLVVMGDTIEHVPDTVGALSEVKRVLRRDGTLICVTPHRHCLSLISTADALARSLLLFWHAKARNKVQPSVYERFLSKSELGRALRRVGFRVQDYRRICFYPGPEGQGMFSLLATLLYRRLGAARSAVMSQIFLRAFSLIESTRVFNQKQMWIVRS